MTKKFIKSPLINGNRRLNLAVFIKMKYDGEIDIFKLVNCIKRKENYIYITKKQGPS